MKKTALVTGATSGIGKATAKILADKGFRIIITGRRKARLQSICQALPDCYAMQFDIRDRHQVDAAFKALPLDWQQIDVLINNAGLAAGLEPLHENLIDDWEQMIDTNIKGLLYVTKIVAPQMINRQAGHIINVSSIAGKEAYAKGAVYCATKHAVEALTKAMRIDFNPYNIKVGSVSPGAVETEFSIVRLKDPEANKKVYAGYTPLKPEDIADAVAYMATRPPHVNIADILILPTAQANATVFNKKN